MFYSFRLVFAGRDSCTCNFVIKRKDREAALLVMEIYFGGKDFNVS